ncbi:MAG: methyltransferase domain-containing protein [Alphaproteobacteria bacterium]
MDSPEPGIEVFDRTLLRQRRDRSARSFADFAFLKDEVSAQLVDRLADIQRYFPVALDLGSHTGSLGRVITQRPDIEALISCDLSTLMVSAADGQRVAADEEALPFADESLNLVVSALSLHWVNDLPGALVQINRALRPDGLFLGALFGGSTLSELRRALMEAEMAVDGGVSPRISPFVDIRDAGGLLQRAGFALPVADSDILTVDYADAFSLMRDLRGMGETNLVKERRRKPMSRRLLTTAVEAYHDLFAREDGRIPATFEIITLTGWAPHESQQKPLAPGSAKMRLADALKTEEKSAGEKAAPAPCIPRTGSDVRKE